MIQSIQHRHCSILNLVHWSHPYINVALATLDIQSFSVVYVGLSTIGCAVCLFSLLPKLDMAKNS